MYTIPKVILPEWWKTVFSKNTRTIFFTIRTTDPKIVPTLKALSTKRVLELGLSLENLPLKQKIELARYPSTKQSTIGLFFKRIGVVCILIVSSCAILLTPFVGLLFWIYYNCRQKEVQISECWLYSFLSIIFAFETTVETIIGDDIMTEELNVVIHDYKVKKDRLKCELLSPT